MDDVMSSLGQDYLSQFDSILRIGHSKYQEISHDLRIEHDARTQASCIYSHIVAEAERQFEELNDVKPIVVRGLKLWVFEDADVVIRFKKMDESGSISNYQTKQQKDFDMQLPLPGVSLPPVRLRVGYLLDEFQSEFVRSQVAAPNGKSILWCAAVHAPEDRVVGEAIWYDAQEQTKLKLAV